MPLMTLIKPNINDLDRLSSIVSEGELRESLQRKSASSDDDTERINDAISNKLIGQVYFKMMEKRVTSKSHIEFEEDFFALTVLSYLKVNKKKHLITHAKQSLNFQNALIVSMAQFVMLWCMFMSFMTGESEADFATSEWVLYVKLPCSLALHVYLYPEVQKGMALMKYANNQPHQFVESGSEISFALGYIQFFLAVFTEGVCVYLLAYQ